MDIDDSVVVVKSMRSDRYEQQTATVQILGSMVRRIINDRRIRVDELHGEKV